MGTKRWYLILTCSILLVTGAACHVSFTTANISSLKMGKDKSASQQTSNFATTDTIYAVADISNAPSAVKVKGRLVVEDVPGAKPGPIPELETTVNLSGSGQASFYFSPPPAGWPKGKYKMEVFMLNEDGEQKDQKSATFTVS